MFHQIQFSAVTHPPNFKVCFIPCPRLKLLLCRVILCIYIFVFSKAIRTRGFVPSHPTLGHFFERSGSVTSPPVVIPLSGHNPLSRLLVSNVVTKRHLQIFPMTKEVLHPSAVEPVQAKVQRPFQCREHMDQTAVNNKSNSPKR